MEAPQTLKNAQPAAPSRAERLRAAMRPEGSSGGAIVGPAAPAVPAAWALAIKRGLDVAVALSLLVLLAAPLLLIAAAVKLSGGGPAFYRQERIGLRGRRFTIYKFRTMRTDAETATGPIWARHNDPRCTALGRFLRRWSLDELPQLWNVLRGDMSLVGPRPERPYFVEQFSRQLPDYPLRHQMRPGLTGWAQVNGWRGNTSIERRLDCDLHYIRHWSLGFDLRILLATPLELCGGRNAH